MDEKGQAVKMTRQHVGAAILDGSYVVDPASAGLSAGLCGLLAALLAAVPTARPTAAMCNAASQHTAAAPPPLAWLAAGDPYVPADLAGGGEGGVQTVEVVCPESRAAGSTLRIESPGGQAFDVVVPAGVQPGQKFTVEIPTSA